ncbi:MULTISPECIES: DUF1214 domain-containing protein [Streptomyces]|uniref:DUF1214 domain-containing protein n=1 Tax=Streptomyces TaxID=1883 RepID=UPI0033F2FBA4|nr:DUF1214 domain-containing protein [Streptomyces fimicarius]
MGLATTLHLQPDRPADPAAAANWLPTPPGPFRPVLRMYQPRPAVFDGTYNLPPSPPGTAPRRPPTTNVTVHAFQE